MKNKHIVSDSVFFIVENVMLFILRIAAFFIFANVISFIFSKKSKNEK